MLRFGVSMKYWGPEISVGLVRLISLIVLIDKSGLHSGRKEVCECLFLRYSGINMKHLGCSPLAFRL